MKLSDYVVDFLHQRGVGHVFLITGGAAGHLTDSLHTHPKMKYVCVQHEQAGAMMAEAYSRMTDNLGVMMGTSGPGATNMITGICCAYFDSIPTLFITGQVNLTEQKGTTAVRQVGFQETDIVSMVKPVTKFAEMVQKPEDIHCLLEKAIYLAQSGRPGPVLLDIPLDIQRAEINPDTLKQYDPEHEAPATDSPDILDAKIRQTLLLLKNAKCPVLLVGGGIRLARAADEARRAAELLGIPIVTTWSGFDIIPHNHPLFVGQMGVYGARGANFTVQNADFLLSVGSRLDTRITGGKPSTYARGAKKIVVDIDAAELGKQRGLTPDIPICVDAKVFLERLNSALASTEKPDVREWIARTQEWKAKYPTVLPEYYNQKGTVNAYVFIKTLSEELGNDAIVITDSGGNLTWTMQAFEVKDGQRVFSAMGNSPMGYSFPAAIGASIARGKKQVICIIGDGGIQMNIQELQTLAYQQTPVKVFVMNNHSYGIILQFQDMYFDGRHAASRPESGYTVPDFLKIASAYGIASEQISHHGELREKIKSVLAAPHPVLCDVSLETEQRLVPKLEFGNPIEDLSPLLDRKEFRENMIIKPLEEEI